MFLKGLIRNHKFIYLLIIIAILFFSYRFFGPIVTVILNLVIVIYSYIIIETEGKKRSLFLITTILWGIYPIIEMVNNPTDEMDVTLSQGEPEKIAEAVMVRFKEDFGSFEGFTISSEKEESCVSDITAFEYQFKGLTYYTEVYDNCDVKKLPTKKESVSGEFSMAHLVYPFWNESEKEKHYFYDMINKDFRKNRISLFVDEDNYLIGKFYDKKGTAYEVPIDVSDWKTEEWALIMLQSNEKNQQISVIFINLAKNDLKMNFVDVANYSIKFEEVNVYTGSDINGKHQADAAIGYPPPWWLPF